MMTFTALIAQLADLSRLGSSALIAAIWQGTLLALAAALALRLIPRIPAAARFAIWFAVFTLIAALPMLQFAPRHLSSTSSAAPAHAFVSLNSRWTIAIATVWAAASLFRAVTLVGAALRVRSLSLRATAIEPCTTEIPATRRIQLCSSPDVDRPTVIGFFSPKILIPAWLIEKLTPAELQQVVLHEASHLTRADDWLNLLQKLALVLFPLNPALAWVERRLCFERELACDERVLHSLAARTACPSRAAADYASCLASLAGYRLQRRTLVRNLVLALGALGASARQSELGRRISRILRPAATMKPLHVRVATGAAIVALLLATTQLEHSPQLISFTSPSSSTQLANPSTNPTSAIEPGAPSYAHARVASARESYRAVVTRFTLPASPQTMPVSAAAHIPGPARSYSAPSLSAHTPAITVHADRPRVDAEPRMIVARQTRQSAPSTDLVIARWTVTAWQSADGSQIVRTRAVLTSAPATQTTTRSHAAQAADSGPRPQQTAQPISPYAAVPVPGGWLVFQL